MRPKHLLQPFKSVKQWCEASIVLHRTAAGLQIALLKGCL